MRSREAGIPDLSEVEGKQLVFELGTHQIELEMQNEELRRFQAQIVESRDAFAELYEFAPVGYVTIDENARIVRANLTATELFQINRDALLGRELRSLVCEEDSDVFFLSYRRIKKTQAHGTIEIRLKRADGEFHARIILGGQRKSAKYSPCRLVAISDISDSVQATVERIELQQKLQESQRLESLGVLAGGIAHDFNNFLSTIALNNTLVAASLEQGSDLRSQTDQIDVAIEQSTALCEQMLVYAGKVKDEWREVDVSSIIQGTAELLRSSVSKNVHLDLLLTEALPLIMGDPSQIVQVVLNLVINASEAIIDGGNVVVATSLWDGEAPSLEETILSNPLTPGEYVCIQVEDTGCGITPENAQRIFEPFFTTKFAGRGIGMSVVSGVVHRHQGTISIDSSVGQGTTFRVLLPAIDAHRLDYINPKRSSAAEETDASSQANILDLGAILVVDDEKTVRFAMQAVLEAVGFRTLAAECGEEAIATIQQADQEISLILLDVTMPGLSIDATIAGMREYRSDIPIVLMSGHHERDLAALMEENAIADFLPKPLGKPVDVVRKVLSTG